MSELVPNVIVMQQEPIAKGPACIICHKQLGKKHITQVSRLKPRFLKIMELQYPKINFSPTQFICKEHFASALQSKVDALLEEDQSEFSKLQEEAMKQIERYEVEEQTWKSFNLIQSNSTGISPLGSDALTMSQSLVVPGASLAVLGCFCSFGLASMKSWQMLLRTGWAHRGIRIRSSC
jgi:hypothetical protein